MQRLSSTSGDARAYITIVGRRSCLLAETNALVASLSGDRSAGFGIPDIARAATGHSRQGNTAASRSPRPQHSQRHFVRISPGCTVGKLFHCCPVSANVRRPASELRAKTCCQAESRDRSRFHRRLAADQQSTRGDAAGRHAARQAASRQSELAAMSMPISFLSGSSILKAGTIWLISSDTLARLPELYEQAAVHQVETRLPQVLVQQRVSGTAAMAVAGDPACDSGRRGPGMAGGPVSPLALVLLGALSQACGGPGVEFFCAPAVAGARGRWPTGFWWPTFAFPCCKGITTSRSPAWWRSSAFNWLLWRILREVLRSVRQRAVLSGRMGTGSLMILGERVLKAAIFHSGDFPVMGTLGFNLSDAARRTGHRRYRHRFRRAKNAGESVRRRFDSG